MLAEARGLDQIMLSMLFSTGLSLEELIAIRVSDLDLVEGFLHLASGRSVPLSPELCQELESYVRGRPARSFLFEGRCGKPVTVKWKRCVLDRLLQRAGAGEQDLSPAG